MRRALGLAVLLAVLAAAPAGAQMAPAPVVLDFEDQAGRGVNAVYDERGDIQFFDGDGCGDVAESGGNFGPRFLDDACGALQMVFASGQATASMFATVTAFTSAPQTTLAVRAYDADNGLLAERTLTVTAGAWSPVTLRAPGDAAAIRRVEIDNPLCCYGIDVDDIGYSPSPQPDTEITRAATTSGGDATFAFAGNQDRMTFLCRLDGGPAEACTSPKGYANLPDGQHTFAVTGVDRWGTADARPAAHAWTVQRVVPPPDRDADGVPDASDNCPDASNADQGDGDADGVGNACELFAPGDEPIAAGVDVRVRLLSGEVFVRLPPGAAASAFTADLRVPFQDGGFLPLKGVAVVPIGSTLDTRRGEVALTAAINGRPARSRRQLRREARFRAGIFAIRQARARRGRSRARRIPPRAELASPAGAEAPCARTAPGGGPLKGVRVRSLSMTAKGVFRAVGGASTATPAKGTATFITTDRCDGTVTEVGRGRVAVVAKKGGRRRVVRAGRAYLVKARLFAVRKGRRNP